MDRATALGTGVIEWGSPVPAFGNLDNSHVATVGLNPSNREFVDSDGRELDGAARRFHTLSSLGIPSWSEADVRHLQPILACCQKYFALNPYDGWFKRLDEVVSGVNASFYGPNSTACHLDLIPYATGLKWTELSRRQRDSLLSLSADCLGLTIKDSPVRVIILNGRSVVDHFQLIAGIQLECERIPEATLGRTSSHDVVGYGFRGTISALSGIPMQREIQILGYNHNLQSSFGVTRQVIEAIKRWLAVCMTPEFK